jgi:hypothetical protein
VEFASTLLDEHDAVTVQEVALALWFELNRVEGMLSKDEDEPSAEESQTTSPESAAGDGEGVLEASGEPEGDEAGESAPNIMFQ